MFLLVTDVIWELAETFYENHRTLISIGISGLVYSVYSVCSPSNSFGNNSPLPNSQQLPYSLPNSQGEQQDLRQRPNFLKLFYQTLNFQLYKTCFLWEGDQQTRPFWLL